MLREKENENINGVVKICMNASIYYLDELVFILRVNVNIFSVFVFYYFQ